MPTLNRRAVLAGTAAVAIAPLPAFALAANPDADLLALGAPMKRDLPEYYEAKRVSHRLHQRTIRAVGHPTDYPDQDFRVYSRRFEAASIKCGYDAAASRRNELHKPLYDLAKQALAMPARTLSGAAVKAMAELVTGEGLTWIHRNSEEDRLWEIASLAGFPVPSWIAKRHP